MAPFLKFRLINNRLDNHLASHHHSFIQAHGYSIWTFQQTLSSRSQPRFHLLLTMFSKSYLRIQKFALVPLLPNQIGPHDLSFTGECSTCNQVDSLGKSRSKS